jgi:two-component system, chemotaxis family, chemotaxis protein CheY
MTESDERAAGARTRILVVDDSSLVRLYCRDVLERAGFKVDHAINGIEAMEKVLAQAFDLVIVDVNMPKMDGFSFLRVLRASTSEAASLPALVITTEAGQQDREDARAAGANYFLVKPASQADLVRHVAALTGTSICTPSTSNSSSRRVNFSSRPPTI